MNEENASETTKDARDTLCAGSGDLPPRIDPLRGVQELGAAARERRARRLMRGLVAAAAVATVGVTTTLFAGSVSDAPSVLATVTGAVAKTSADSYRFSLNSTVQYAGRELQSSTVTGAFDSRHEVGAELLARRVGTVKAQIRFIGKYLYTCVSPESRFWTVGKPWDKSPAPPPGADVVPGDDLYGFSTEQPVSLVELLGMLRSVATVRDEGPAIGQGWTGTRYGFSVPIAEGQSVSGTVYVDQQGRVRRLVTITTTHSRAPHSRVVLTINRMLTFGDFGAAVSVTAPPASQIKYTNVPYRGFFF